MAHKKTKLKNKIWSLALCASMILSCLPISAFAETDSDLCEHHHEHTAECGYVAAEEGQPCTHEHTDDCYSIVKCVHEHDENCGKNGESCTHVCSEDSGCITVKHNCHHTHDENCGYVEGVPAYDCTHECGEECAEGCVHEHDETCGYAEETEATPCIHVCSIEGGCYELVCSHAVEGQHDDTCGYVVAVEGSPCKYECEEDHGEEETTESTETSELAYTAEDVKAMIDALPSVSEMESMSEDELSVVYKNAEKAYDAFETLTDEEQIELADELVKLRDVLDYTTGFVTPLATGTGPYGVSLSFSGSYICYTCGAEDSYIKSISIHSISLSGNQLIISATLYANCGHNVVYEDEGSRLVVANFSCTSTYSYKAMTKEGNTKQEGVFFSRQAGHSPDSWSFSNDQHCGYCNLCQKNVTENCSGGTATCLNKAVCTTCKNEYGSIAAHNYINNATSNGEGQHTGNCEWCSAEGTQACSYENGICKYCGSYQIAEQNSDGYYEISNAGQLLWFANQANTVDAGINGKLTANIDLENHAWTPIGTKSNSYTGTFDGNGKTVSKLSFDDLTADYVGLFGYIKAPAVIRNVALKNSSIRAREYVGGIVGYAYANGGDITIENCTNEAEIYSEYVSSTGSTVFSYAGGIVGYVYAEGSCNITIQNCTNNAKISGIGSYMGGVVGYITAKSADTKASLLNCTNSGSEVSDEKGYCVGGIIASASASSGKIILKNCKNSATVTGNYNVGGLAGKIIAFNGGTIEVDDCSNSGSITASSTSSCSVGGIIGDAEVYNYGGVLTIANCANSGTVQAASAYAGGIVGNTQVYGQYENDAATLKIYGCNNSGSIISSSNYVGGIIGFAYTRTGGANVECTLEITQCFNTGAITGAVYVGGIAGGSNMSGSSASTSNIKISTCYNTGNVTSTSTSNNSSYTGGIVGFSYMHINNDTDVMMLTTELSNCYNTGTVTGVGTGVGAICGVRYYAGVTSGTNYTAKFETSNNYYLTGCATDGNDVAQLGLGSSSLGGTTADGDGKYKGMSADQFTSGEVAYLLNGSTNAGAWKQTVNSDKYPSLSGKDVYGGYICGSGSSDMVYQNSIDGILSEPHPEHGVGDDGICVYCGAAIRPGLNNGVYEIKNLGHLQWFVDYVNAGNTSINSKLMADIDASSAENLGIGTDSYKYAGIFDGNGYTITIKLNGSESVALFPYVNGATIKNLTVKGYITASGKYAATLVGQAEGNVTIEKCISAVEITSTVSGDGTHGGLVGVLNSGTLNINNCGFIGAINGSSTNSCGGLVGWSNGTTKISNSFVATTFSVSATNGNTFSRGNNITVTNCYYLNALGDAPSEATQKNADQFASGEVAYLLNGSKDNGSWKQTLGENGDTYPNFSGGAVYKITPCETGYTNNESEKTNEHDFNEQGFCKDCNGYQPALWNNEDNVYEISNAGQLMWFAGLVNGTLKDVAQNQSANAILKNDLDMSGITEYVPIGGTTGLYYNSEGTDKGYQGTFDGNGHVIKILSVTGSNTAQLTYGVFGTLSGTVKHLGVENFTFTLGSQDCRAGGIVGQMLSGGLVEDCYVANSTITATGKVAGGIAGCNYAGTIKNCFTYKVTVTATRSGGIVGDNRGDGGADDRKGTIINCYTDASAIESSDRAGNVSTSKANVGTTDFSSGLLAWSLNGEKVNGVWKQTIGTNEFPCFDGNDLSFNTGNYADSDNNISLQIIWTSLEFTYYAGEWDASTHAYTGEGYWETDMENGDVITIRNTGSTAVRIDLSYESNLDGVIGAFDKGGVTLNDGEIFSSKLALSGTPSEGGFTNKEIGRISISIEKSLKVGETVTYNGYECTVLEIRDDKYILMTSTHVREYGTGRTNGEVSSMDDIPNWVAFVGARLPDANYATEKSAMRAIMNANRNAQFYPVSNYSSYSLYIKYNWGGNFIMYDDTVSGINRNGILVYLVFEVPFDYDF